MLCSTGQQPGFATHEGDAVVAVVQTHGPGSVELQRRWHRRALNRGAFWKHRLILREPFAHCPRPAIDALALWRGTSRRTRHRCYGTPARFGLSGGLLHALIYSHAIPLRPFLSPQTRIRSLHLPSPRVSLFSASPCRNVPLRNRRTPDLPMSSRFVERGRTT